MLFRRGLLLVTLLLCTIYGFGQQGNYSITHYTTDQGLPQNSIKSIGFDEAGYCWLGTEMGLARFDGTNFKVFGSENIKGLLSDRLGIIARDSAGNTFAQMDNGQQMAITIDQSGRAPFPQLLKGRPMCFSGEKFLLAKSPVISQAMNSLADSVRNNTGSTWMATSNLGTYINIGVNLYYAQHGALKQIGYMSDFDDELAMIRGKLIRFLPNNGKIKVWQDGVLQTQICSISGPLGKDKHFASGSYNLLTSTTGVYVYAGKTVYRIDIKNNQPESEVVLKDINIPDIHSIYYHRGQQRYYIGTLTSGLYIVEPLLFHYPQMAELAINLGFRTQIATKGGEGIISEKYIYHRDGTFETIPLQNRMGCTVYRDQENVLNYGTGLAFFRLKLSTQQTSKLFDLDGRPVTIVEDKTDSNCTLISTGMSVIKFYNGAFKIFKQMPEGKADNAIWGLIQTGKDSFLLTTEKGLKWYDWAHNRIFHSVLDSFSINSVYAESADRIWISTYGNGFFLYGKGKLYRLPCGNFTALRSVHFFADDGRGSFWLPTNNGLYKVRKDALLDYAFGKSKEVYYYSFTTRNGLRSNEFNGRGMPYYVWLKDSMLSLLSIKGPVWFYPNNIPIDYPDKHIYVDQVKVNDSEILYPATGLISLLPDFENITLTVSSPYFGNKENLQLRYKIEGISTDWQPVAANGKIQLNRVPSGHYRLIVSKLTGRNINQYESLILSIIVKPWFYNTWGFYTIILILICLATYLTIKLRTRLLVDRNRKLQGIIESQTEGLTKTVALLSTSEQELKESNLLKDNVITMVLHDLRSPIRFLHIISRKTATRYAELDKQELGQKLVEINTSIAALSDFTEQFFGWAVSQRKDFKVNKTSFDLQLLFEETADLYEDLVKINNNTLKIIPGNYQVYTDRNILSVILRNLLDNANKNTSDGEILLHASYTSEHLVITVSDTGKGLRESQLDAFMAKEGNGSETGSGSGYGSMIIRNLLEKIGGVLKIDTEPDTGARFQVWLDRSGTPNS